MDSDLKIKDMDRRDVAAVVSLVQREFPFDSAGVEPRIKEAIKGRRGQLARDRRPNLVLEDDGRFAGYATVKPFETGDSELPLIRERGATAVLVQVAVEPQLRNRGGGEALVRAAIEATRDAGYHQLLAHIPTEHGAFYAGLGFDVPAEGWGWAWIEEHTADDTNIAHKLGPSASKDPGWVPILVETPTVAGYPVVARLLLNELPASAAFVPHSARSSPIDGGRALANQVVSTSGWDRIPVGTASELRKYVAQL